jgi:hypothetical protein
MNMLYITCIAALIAYASFDDVLIPSFYLVETGGCGTTGYRESRVLLKLKL